MENNLDQDIREKLHAREIQPSASAWERLSSQLDDAQQKKKKGWFLFMGYAASILLLVSLFLFFNQKDQTQVQDNTLVQEEVKAPEIDTSKEFISLPVENEVIAQEEKVEKKKGEGKKEVITKKNVAPNFKSPIQEPVIASQTEQKEIQFEDVQQKIKELTRTEETVVATTSNEVLKDSGNPIKKEGIYVDSEALLLSVTSTREELRSFYKKYKVDRAEVLATIEKELKKSSLKVDPKTILAEVEKDVNEENFQNNFYRFIKKRVSDVATAIANRNN